MDTPKVSVIVPVYNALSSLEECVTSLLCQSLTCFEILLIDDGSTDGSHELCEKLAEGDKRIRVFHKENGGAASARNMGLDNAVGEFIAFTDSDDTVNADFLKKMYDSAIAMQADIVMCDYLKCTKDRSFPFSSPIRGGTYKKEDIIKELYSCLIMFDNMEFPPTISNWSCLFRRSMIERIKLRYPCVRLCEDSYFGSVALYNADCYVYLKGETLYNYRYTDGSLSHGINPKRWESFVKLNELYEQYFSSKEEIFNRQIKYNMLYFAMNQLSYVRGAGASFAETRKQVRQIMHCERLRHALKGTKLPTVSFKLKLAMLLVKYRQAFLYTVLLGRKQ